MVIGVTMYPLEDDPDAQLMASARLVLPAELSLEMQFRAGIAASVVIASATGCVTLTGGVRLRGGLDASAHLTTPGTCTFDAMARSWPARADARDRRDSSRSTRRSPGRGSGRSSSRRASYGTGLQFGLSRAVPLPIRPAAAAAVRLRHPLDRAGPRRRSARGQRRLQGPPRHRRLTSLSSVVDGGVGDRHPQLDRAHDRVGNNRRRGGSSLRHGSPRWHGRSSVGTRIVTHRGPTSPKRHDPERGFPPPTGALSFTGCGSRSANSTTTATSRCTRSSPNIRCCWRSTAAAGTAAARPRTRSSCASA